MFEKRRLDWSYLLLCPFLAITYLPWLKYRLQFRHVFPLMLIWAGVAYATRRKLRVPRAGVSSLALALVVLGIFSGIDLIYLVFGVGDGMDYVGFVDLVMVFFFLSIFHFSVCNGRLRELRLLVFFCFACMAISAAMNFMGESLVENGSRILTGSEAEGADLGEITAAASAGMGGFGYIYGMGLLVFPVLFFASAMPLPLKVLFSCLMVVFLGTVYKAGYTILMVGLLISGVLYLIVKSRVNLGTMKLFGIVLITILVTAVISPKIMNFMITPLQSLADLIGKEEYQIRTQSMADAVSGEEETYTVTRSELYWKSWRTFTENPLFGIGRYDYRRSSLMEGIGGHSMFFDTLGFYGLFGMSLYILFFVFHYRYMQVMSSMALGFQWWPGYYIYLFPFIAISFINPIGGFLILSDLLLFIPALAVCFKRNNGGVNIQRLNDYSIQRGGHIPEPVSRKRMVWYGKGNDTR